MREQQLQALRAAGVLPVITPTDPERMVDLCACLFEAGMGAVELTLRSDTALASISAVRQRLPKLLVTAGTVLDGEDLRAAVDAGAQCCISPGISTDLMSSAREQGVDLLPGVASASEVMLGLSFGQTAFKLFPAVAVGGLDLIRSLGGPFPEAMFCPTGGLGPYNFRDYLALPNVFCCGGSWMVKAELVDNEDWQSISALARAAVNRDT